MGGSEIACWTDIGNRGNSLRRIFCGRERDSMLDGQGTVQLACRMLRWEGARQHAGRMRHRAKSWAESSAGKEREGRANSWRKESMGGSETACWTDRKRRK